MFEDMWMHERCGYAEVTDEDAEAEPNNRDIDLIRWANERALSSRSRLGTLAAPRTTAQSPSIAEDVRVIARYALGEPEDPMRGSNQYTDAFASYVRWLNISRPDLVAGGDDAVLLRLSHDGLKTLGEAQAVAARFAIHMHSSGLKGTTLTSALRTMKRVFFLRGSETAESLWSTQSNPLLALANVGCRLSAAEEKELIKGRISRKPDAILSEMQAWLRERLWTTPWHTDAGMNSRGAFACLVLGIDFALRPSNLLRGDKRRVRGEVVRNPHVLLGAEVIFVVEGETGEEHVSAALLRTKLKGDYGGYVEEKDVERVTCCLFRILTSKTTTGVGTAEATSAGARLRYLGRRTTREETHLVVLACWCANCGARDEEPIFSRIGPQSHRRRYLTRKDIVQPLKEAATHLGFNPDRYTAKSMRVTYASVAEAAEVPLEEINQTGWAPGSVVGSAVYSRALHARNTAVLLTPDREGLIERAIAQSTVRVLSQGSTA